MVPQRPGDEAASKGGQLQGLLGGGQGEGVAAAGAPVVQGQVLRDLPPRMVTSDSCLAGSPSWTVAGPPRKEPEFLQCLRFSFFSSFFWKVMLQLLSVYLSVRLLIGNGFEIVSVYHKLFCGGCNAKFMTLLVLRTLSSVCRFICQCCWVVAIMDSSVAYVCY